ncbi:hypothetical protein B0T17DRAFT_410988 [Bombardia bombarda]|uniref:Uncharacterized protein n=1 Tax=Bombardia bombarda TaxID=252184 RepID=A0AA39U7A9_9PEZI|nr:hypothetical protein B0T17DRAFT_410988 [Bombardia bombarda]
MPTQAPTQVPSKCEPLNAPTGLFSMPFIMMSTKSLRLSVLLSPSAAPVTVALTVFLAVLISNALKRSKRNKSVATGKRALSKTTKKECLWKAKAVFFVEPINAWKFAIMHEDHCHPVINSFAPFFPVHRRLARTEDVVARILSYLKQPKNTFFRYRIAHSKGLPWGSD